MKRFKAAKNYLRSVGRQTVNNAKNFLRTKGIEGSKLEESISYNLVNGIDGFVLEFRMSEYGVFLDKGVSGNSKKQYYIDHLGAKRQSPFKYKQKAPPTKVFEKWIKKKGIKGRSKKTGRFITTKSLAFAMSRYRMVNGYAGLSFFSKPLNAVLTKFPKNLLDSIETDILKVLPKKSFNEK
tara:strand:- start:22 stop:564 length:543 start_codon:yes stop_codon:yes gene_type:complete